MLINVIIGLVSDHVDAASMLQSSLMLLDMIATDWSMVTASTLLLLQLVTLFTCPNFIHRPTNNSCNFETLMKPL